MNRIRSVDVRWIWRYKLFCMLGIIIMIFQICIALILFASYDETDANSLGRTKINDNNYVSDYDDGHQLNNKFVYMDPVFSNKVDVMNLQHVSNKNLSDLKIEPVCNITSKDALSAIRRAKTRSCKQLIANVSCLMRSNKLYPQILPHMCPINAEFKKGKSLGCYRGNVSTKILSGAYYNYSVFNSVEYCVNKCIQAGYSYAGVQFSDECYCGNDRPSTNLRVEHNLCNYKCAANAHQICGGYFAINIFETGVAKFSAQIPKEPKTDLGSYTSKVRIVFLLTLNGRAVRQVYRLIKTLFHRDHFFFIHVDARQDYMFRELLSLELHFQNIKLLRYRYDTIWGGASLLTMLLHAMSELVKSSWDWDFIINLSESDFPIKTNEELVAFLSANTNRNFVKSHGRDVQHFILKQGLDKTFVECDERMWRVSDRTLPTGIVIDGGSDWIALSRTFVDYIITHHHIELLQGLNTLFGYTLLPAETYFHTVLRNSPYCNTYVDNNLHVTNWKRHLGCKCQYKHVVDWCGCSPNAFTTDDWHKIQNTKEKRVFFARKFEPIVSQSVLDKIERWLRIQTTELANQHGYWQNMYHHADISPPLDEALYSVGSSLSRIALKLVNRNHNCESFDTSQLLQIHSYHRYDQQLGILIEYEITSKSGDERMRLESWFNILPQFRIIKSNSVFGSRLTAINVNSNYDLKEQIARNLASAIGSLTEPVLIFQVLSSNESSNVTFLWIDPTNVIVDVTTQVIEEQPTVHHIKPNMSSSPLLPGIWRVNLVCNNETVAQIKFLVTPLEIRSGPYVNPAQSLDTRGDYYGAVHDEWSYLLSDVGENKSLDFVNSLRYKLKVNSQKMDSELRNWIDSLVVRFYKITDSCIIDSHRSSHNRCEILDTPMCNTTIWSSYAPDPKSDIMSLKTDS